MRISFKGIYNASSQLKESNVPKDATKFNFDKNSESHIFNAYIFMLPIAIVISLFVGISFLLHGYNRIGIDSISSAPGFVLWIASLIAHEYLHGLCYGKGATVEVYLLLERLVLFMSCAEPLSKYRYVFMLLLPNVLLGILPLMLWVAIPHSGYNSSVFNALFTFSSLSLLAGCLDFFNCVMVMRNIPRGSMIQQSKNDLYWYYSAR